MKIIGHRGARGLAPENTSFGIQKALQHLRYGEDMIEFDVRVTKDDIPILHHDTDITDPDGKHLKINRHSYKELKSHFPDLTTLERALGDIDAKVTAYIEVKPGEPVELIITILNQFIGGMYSASNLRLASKSQKTLRALHTALPDVPTLVIEPWSGIRAHRRAKQVGAREIAMNQRWLWWGFIRGFKHSDKQLFAYTLNDPVKARRWAKWGLAGVITDYPDRFEK